LHPEVNQYAERFIIKGKKYGFITVYTVDWNTLFCVQAISQTNYEVKENDVIGVLHNSSFYIWQNNVGNYSAKNFQSFLKGTQLNFNAIFCNENIEANTKMVKKYFPQCQIFSYDKNNWITTLAALRFNQIMVCQKRSQHTQKQIEGSPEPVSQQFQAEPQFSQKQLFAPKATQESPLIPSFKTFSDKNETYTIPKKIELNDENIEAVGIDLGTSQCCVAVNRRNGIETVPIDNSGERLLPSYVAFDEENPKCGQVVVDRLRYYSEYTIFDSKRFIGKNFSEVKIDKSWPFELINFGNKPIIKIVGMRKTPDNIASVLLTHIKKKTEEFQGKKHFKAVITVPTAFTESQKNATQFAAGLAGWDSAVLLPEPVAASFAYFIERPIPQSCILLLFDLGGGTLDVCVSKVQNGKIQTISNSGDQQLGGRDFDNLLINYFLKKLKEGYGVMIIGPKRYKLMLECQKIKHNLSVRNDEKFDVEDFDPAKKGFIQISRKMFEDLSKELLIKIKTTIRAALQNAKCDVNQIQKVLQVGGGCRMPMIKELLKEIFPFSEQCCEQHPEEVVAIGAAYYSYYNNF
jgi:heat shock protein 1/8